MKQSKGNSLEGFAETIRRGIVGLFFVALPCFRETCWASSYNKGLWGEVVGINGCK